MFNIQTTGGDDCDCPANRKHELILALVAAAGGVLVDKIFDALMEWRKEVKAEKVAAKAAAEEKAKIAAGFTPPPSTPSVPPAASKD